MLIKPTSHRAVRGATGIKLRMDDLFDRLRIPVEYRLFTVIAVALAIVAMLPLCCCGGCLLLVVSDNQDPLSSPRPSSTRKVDPTVVSDVERLIPIDEPSTSEVSSLSKDAAELLALAAASPSGAIHETETSFSGKSLSVGNKRLFAPKDGPRARARWEAALAELRGARLVEYGRTRTVYSDVQHVEWRVTAAGFAVADRMAAGAKQN